MGTPTNKKQTILELIKTKFEAVSSTGGSYFYSYSGKVFLNKQTAFTVMGVNIQDASEDFLEEDSSGTLHDNELMVDINIVCPTAADIANIYKHEADILKCIGNNLTWEGNALLTKYMNTIRDKTDQLGNKIADQTIRIRIQYRKTAWNI